MFSYAFSSASSYFHLPIDDDEDEDSATGRDARPWSSAQASSLSASASKVPPLSAAERREAISQVLRHDDLYQVLGVARSTKLDKFALRRAYLARSKACHPDKFPNDPEATNAFQKVSVAYDILSQPSSRRVYDARARSGQFDYFAARPTGHAEETFRGVIIGVFNDFLDGDLEVIRTLLRAINDINPSLRLGDEGINSVLVTLQSIRERALTCRTFIFALHAELTRLLEAQHAFRQLSYFDLLGRSRVAVQLTRITLALPLALENALQAQGPAYLRDERGGGGLLPGRVHGLIRGIDVVLERMERILGAPVG